MNIENTIFNENDHDRSLKKILKNLWLRGYTLREISKKTGIQIQFTSNVLLKDLNRKILDLNFEIKKKVR